MPLLLVFAVPAITVAEPMTLATDYVLGVLAIVFARRLAAVAKTSSQRHWLLALTALAVAALAGGTVHGFPEMPAGVRWTLWKLTLAAIGVAAYAVIQATAGAHLSARSQAFARGLGLAQLLAYLAWISQSDDFVVAILDYGLAFVFALVVHTWAWMQRSDRAARITVFGVLVSFVGAAIQAKGVAIHPSFNHNDLYHVIQMLGTWLLYRGALPPTPPGRAS